MVNRIREMRCEENREGDFMTDPIDHALWAGIAAYFIGRAITPGHPTASAGGAHIFHRAPLILVGLALAAVLHGLNDYLAGHFLAQTTITLVSAAMLLGYAARPSAESGARGIIVARGARISRLDARSQRPSGASLLGRAPMDRVRRHR